MSYKKVCFTGIMKTAPSAQKKKKKEPIGPTFNIH